MRSFLRRSFDHDARVAVEDARAHDTDCELPLLGTKTTSAADQGGLKGRGSDRDKVTNWLLEAPEIEVLAALRALGASKGYLIERAWQDACKGLRTSDRLSPAQRNDAEDIPPAGGRLAAARLDSDIAPIPHGDPSHAVDTSKPVLKFAASMFFCTESDQNVEVGVMRIGDCSARSEIDYATRDGSAKAGVNYESVAGRLIFESGEVDKRIAINLIDNDVWAPLQEFGVDLLEQGAINVCLECGYSVSVKVIDDDFFPSPKYQGILDAEGAHQNMSASLIWDYFKLNFRQSGVMTATVKQIMVEQSRNVIFAVGLFLQVFMVDVVLKSDPGAGGAHFNYVCCIVLWHVLSHAWTHFWDYRTITFRTAGMSRMVLQSALLRTYLHHDEKDRPLLRRGDLEMVINVMVPELVQSGYMSMIRLAGKVGKLGMLVVFQLASPVVFHGSLKPTGLVASAVFPLVLGLFFFARRQTMERVRDEEQKHNSALFEHVEQSSEFYHLVAGFGRQNLFVSKFESLIRSYNNAVIERLQVSTNNVYFAKWWGTAAVGFYTAFGGWQVLNEVTPLGMFLANAASLRTMGDIWDGIYTDLLEMYSALPALWHIMKLMNLTTDAIKRMHFQKACMSTTLRKFEEDVPQAGLYPSGTQKTLDNVPFQIKSSDNSSLELLQGQLIAVIGVNGSGKGGLLKILGGVKYPDKIRMDRYFVPSHLRLVHIGESPLLFRGSLWDNLTFGSDSGISSERVTEICSRLGVSQRLLELLKPDARIPTENNWMEVLSMHDMQVLSLARGFICNPDVLVLHTPTIALDEDIASRCFGMMREFVGEKGVAVDAPTASLRGPRSCIFSASRVQGIDVSDRVVLVARGKFREVSKEEAYDAVGPMTLASNGSCDGHSMRSQGSGVDLF